MMILRVLYNKCRCSFRKYHNARSYPLARYLTNRTFSFFVDVRCIQVCRNFLYDLCWRHVEKCQCLSYCHCSRVKCPNLRLPAVSKDR